MLQPQWKYLINHWIEVSWGTEYLHSLGASPIDHLFLREKGTFTAEPWGMAPWPSDCHRWYHLSWGSFHRYLQECPVEGPQPFHGIPANKQMKACRTERGPELFTHVMVFIDRGGLWNQDKVTRAMWHLNAHCIVQGWILSGGKIAIKESCIRLFCCCVSIWSLHWVMFQVALVVKNLLAGGGDVRDAGSIPGWGRSPGEGHGSPLQYSFPREAHGQRSLAGYSHWDSKVLDTTEVTQNVYTARILIIGGR